MEGDGRRWPKEEQTCWRAEYRTVPPLNASKAAKSLEWAKCFAWLAWHWASALTQADRIAVKAWGLPWKVFLRKRNRKDPAFARYVHEANKEASGKALAKQHAKFSPYYLPAQGFMHPARQEFMEGSVQPELNLWWRDSPALTAAFRRRLGEAKSFEQAHPDHREPSSFAKEPSKPHDGPPCPFGRQVVTMFSIWRDLWWRWQKQSDDPQAGKDASVPPLAAILRMQPDLLRCDIIQHYDHLTQHRHIEWRE
eukprot:s60_g62.t1